MSTILQTLHKERDDYLYSASNCWFCSGQIVKLKQSIKVIQLIVRLTTLIQKSKYHKLLVIRPTPVIGLSNCKQTIYPVKAPLGYKPKVIHFLCTV